MSDLKRYHEEWTDLLSEHLAGALDPVVRGRLEDHLADCAECRGVYAELRAVMEGAAALPELQPPRDLWPDIAAAIAAEGAEGAATAAHRGAAIGSGDPHVIELPTARAPRRPALGLDLARLSANPFGLAAAAAGLVLVTATATWWLAAPVPGAAGAGNSPAAAGAAPVLAVDTGTPPEGLANELAALEAALQVARTSLDPNTVLVLERNLAVIELAISDSREALALDPGNAFLSEHLERMYRRKLDYMQDAVRAVEWSG